MIIIYIDKQTNRLGYTINLIFKDVLKTDFMVTTRKDTFIAETGAKISYCKNSICDEIHITSKDLLFETSLSNVDVEYFEKDSLPCLFPTYSKDDTLGFDIFSAVFYMVSRYEEYLPFMSDKHGRFSPNNSIAYQKGFLELPVVNLWVERLKQELLRKYPNLQFADKEFTFTNTIDIDMAYYYKSKGFYRTIGGWAKDLLKRDFYAVKERFKVIVLNKKDPYSCYDFIQTIINKYKFKTILFYLFAMRSKYDKNISPYYKSFQLLVKDMADYSKTGIHPSYYVMEEPETLKEQIDLLEKIIHTKIYRSRFHFLRFRLPVSYRNLIENEIKDVYSMGYADCVGFRAGIASSFNFYDIERDYETKLRVHPFAFMDVSLKNGMGLNREKSWEKIRSLIDIVKSVKGEFISIWHNESLSNYREWKDWRKIYEKQLDYIYNNKE